MWANQFTVFDYAPVGIFVINRQYEVIFWNKCLAQWTGIQKETILNESIFTQYPHLKGKKYLSRFDGALNGGPATIFSSQLHNHLLPITLPNGVSQIQRVIVTGSSSDEDPDSVDAIFMIQDYSKIETRQLELEKSIFSLKGFVSKNIELFSASTRAKCVDLSLKYISPLPVMVRGDINRIRHILFIILENALKYTEKGRAFYFTIMLEAIKETESGDEISLAMD